VARSKQGYVLALVLAAAVVAADQLTKWVVRALADRLPVEWVLGLHLQITYNSGISFSRLAGAGDVVIVLVAAVAVGVTIALVLAPPRYRPALGVILGGALGNLIDRVRLDGSVLDFIGFYSWPQFNLADAAIVLGTILLGVQVVFVRHE
jgi:signal peptidase II